MNSLIGDFDDNGDREIDFEEFRLMMYKLVNEELPKQPNNPIVKSFKRD